MRSVIFYFMLFFCVFRAPDASERPNFQAELYKLEANMEVLQRKQDLLDSEEALIDREEHLAKRSMRLKEFEKEVKLTKVYV